MADWENNDEMLTPGDMRAVRSFEVKSGAKVSGQGATPFVAVQFFSSPLSSDGTVDMNIILASKTYAFHDSDIDAFIDALTEGRKPGPQP